MAAATIVAYLKDPDATLDFTWDWSQYLVDSDTIVSATVFLSPGITLNSFTWTTTSVIAWVQGGQAGNSYLATARVTTAGGRTDDRSLTIKVQQM